MTYEQSKLLEDFALLEVRFPDSKTMNKNLFSYFFKEEDCTLFPKKNYTHEEYIEIIKGVFDRNSDSLNEIQEAYLENHKDMVNRYSVAVYSQLPQ